jgi:tRNA dimethylallyltransferase
VPFPFRQPEHPLVVILGPTGSGKTALALALAERFHGEIVSCDSVAVYREMELGTAKPTAVEQARVPHHLINVASPSERYTAGDYSRHARARLHQIALRRRLPIVSGGTGLYLRALLEGLAAAPGRSDPVRARLRQSAARHGSSWLQRLLARIDPASAARIHANDESKLIRAIEVSVAARLPMSETWKTGREPLRGFRILRIGLEPERKALYARIDRRAAAMFSAGLIEETRGLLERYGETQALGALGYRQAAAVVRGEISEAEAVRSAQQGHRNYAKRQLTWFRREPEVLWIRSFGDEPAVIAAAIHAVGDTVNAAG